MYERYGKRLLDIILSLAATIILAIPMGLVALWIKLDSPGPVFFKQRRVGKGKTYFNILKFRTMRGDTPHDVPTHLLKDADSYITGSGAFLRKTSLDELPQIFNIRLQYAAEHVPVIDILRRLDPLCRGQTVPGHLLQCLLHGWIAVKAQLRGKADHRGFADLRQLSQLAGRHERRLVIMVQDIASNSFLPL